MMALAVEERLRPATGALGERVEDGGRLQAIDLLRGLIIILMVLDHVRDFFHAGAIMSDPVDPKTSYLALYVTRWVTHLCAPNFVMLAGISAFLKGTRCDSRAELSKFLLTRGLWLVLLELTVVNFGWTFGAIFSFVQVIYAIGGGMVVLSALVWLGPRLVLALGVLIVAGHGLLGPIDAPYFGQAAPIWNLLEEPGVARLGSAIVFVAYPLLPWLGIMCLGYGLGPLFLKPQPQRTRRLLMLGGGFLVLFLALRGINLYGDPNPWTFQPEAGRTVMSFFNVTKYPPSLAFDLATLGVGFLLLAAFERLKGLPAKVLLTYGGVPLFVYVAHVYLAHGLELLTGLALGFPASAFVDSIVDPSKLNGWGFPLWAVYPIWIGILALLYPAARWFSEVKRRRRDWWLSYL